MAIANTTIQIKKSLTSGNTPSSLANGEIAINQVDGKLYYRTPAGVINYINNQQTFATINANNSLILAGTTTDTLSFAAANGISITANTTSKTITIDGAITQNLANSAYVLANTAYNRTNTNTANVLINTDFTNGTYTVTIDSNGNVRFPTNFYSQASIGPNAVDKNFSIFAGSPNKTWQFWTSGLLNIAGDIAGPSTVSLTNVFATTTNTLYFGSNTSTLYVGGANTNVIVLGNITNNTILANTGTSVVANSLTQYTFANTTASTSNTTGALKVSGGIGVAGNVYANSIYTNGLYYAANGNPISTGGSVTLSDSISSNSSANAATSNAVYIAVSTALAYSIALG